VGWRYRRLEGLRSIRGCLLPSSIWAGVRTLHRLKDLLLVLALLTPLPLQDRQPMPAPVPSDSFSCQIATTLGSSSNFTLVTHHPTTPSPCFPRKGDHGIMRMVFLVFVLFLHTFLFDSITGTPMDLFLYGLNVPSTPLSDRVCVFSRPPVHTCS